MNGAVEKFIIVPVVAVIGIIVVGGMIEQGIGIVGATVLLFGAVGGIAFIGHFFKK